MFICKSVLLTLIWFEYLVLIIVISVRNVPKYGTVPKDSSKLRWGKGKTKIMLSL